VGSKWIRGCLTHSGNGGFYRACTFVGKKRNSFTCWEVHLNKSTKAHASSSRIVLFGVCFFGPIEHE